MRTGFSRTFISALAILGIIGLATGDGHGITRMIAPNDPDGWAASRPNLVPPASLHQYLPLTLNIPRKLYWEHWGI